MTLELFSGMDYETILQVLELEPQNPTIILSAPVPAQAMLKVSQAVAIIIQSRALSRNGSIAVDSECCLGCKEAAYQANSPAPFPVCARVRYQLAASEKHTLCGNCIWADCKCQHNVSLSQDELEGVV